MSLRSIDNLIESFIGQIPELHPASGPMHTFNALCAAKDVLGLAGMLIIASDIPHTREHNVGQYASNHPLEEILRQPR